MAYFDNAATTYPKPQCVYDYMDTFYRASGGSFGRGNYSLSNSVKQVVTDTRNKIQKLLHCPNKQVIFEPTATISLNIILQGLIGPNIRNVYISPFEHNAVTRTLHHYEANREIQVRQLAVGNDFSYDLQRIQYQFEANRPDLVVVSHASNVIGLIAPVDEIFILSKKYNAINVLDMSQTAGLVECEIGKDQYDFAVFAGHKTLLGPTGLSGFVMKPTITLQPVIFGGTGYDSANPDMPDSLPERYEMGTMNISGVAGLNAALSWIESYGIGTLYTEEIKARNKLLELLSQYDFIQIIGNSEKQHYVGIISCLIEGISSDIAGQLFSERDVAVRTGLHCAPLAHRFLGTFPAGTIRFSVNHFTSDSDFEVLKRALDDIEDNL